MSKSQAIHIDNGQIESADLTSFWMIVVGTIVAAFLAVAV